MPEPIFCLIDESLQSRDGQSVSSLAAVLMCRASIDLYGRFHYSIVKKYMGDEKARDRDFELKGSELLRPGTFRLYAKSKSMPSYHCIAKDLLIGVHRLREDGKGLIGIIASVVWGSHETLVPTEPKNLSRPFMSLCQRISLAATACGREAILVFDQRHRAQDLIATAVHNYLAGTNLQSVFPYPVFGHSHLLPGLQLADITAYILAARGLPNTQMKGFYQDLLKSRWDTATGEGRARPAIDRMDRISNNQYDRRETW